MSSSLQPSTSAHIQQPIKNSNRRCLYLAISWNSFDMQGGEKMLEDWKYWSNLGSILLRLKEQQLEVGQLSFLQGVHHDTKRLKFLILINIYADRSQLIYLLEMVQAMRVETLRGFMSLYQRII